MVLCLSLCGFHLANSQSLPLKVAEQFLSQKLSAENRRTDVHFDEPTRIGNIWIFESHNPDGFVLVREADSSSVVGYSTSNRFTRNKKIPDPALTFLESLSHASNADIYSSRIKTKYNPIGPLIRSKWSQEGYFNYYCPKDPNGPDYHVFAGCAAVAMGQIIRYYGKSNGFLVTAVNSGTSYGTLTATLGNFDWSRMENQPITIDTEVSKLLFGLGVLTQMYYSPSGSTTSNYNVYSGFKKLKYFDAVRMVRSSTTPEVWVRNFTQNLADFEPIYVSGSGHSFVCDGIDEDGMFHFNLGWYGYADGFYPLNVVSNINPSEAIFNLKPYSNNLPPANLRMDITNGQKILTWEKNRLATTDPSSYRIYLNDTAYYENSSTVFNTIYFPPGNHELMVSAVYPQGESTAIGPIQYEVEGNPVEIPDLTLKLAIQEELIRENVTPVTDYITVNQLLKINRLDIHQAPATLSGLEYCHNLQVINILPDKVASLDIGPITLLKRLKWLELENIQIANPDLLSHNDRLVHLDLIRSPAGNLGFLNLIPGLLSFKADKLEIADTQIFGTLGSLTQLTITDCNLTSSSFVQSLVNLEYLDLSNNLLTRFRLNDKLPELNYLDISHNQIPDLFFLEFIPNIETLNIGSNLINRFVTGLNFKNIKELNLENNTIDSLSMAVPMLGLKKLKLSRNKIRTVKYLQDYSPALEDLDLSENNIHDFWLGSLQQLKFLNLSGNRIDLLNDLTANPLLEHIDLSSNLLPDLYPIFDHDNSYTIKFLDLTGNPLSEESVEEFAPYLRTVIDTLVLPDEFQEFTPGNPQPARNYSVTAGKATMSWKTSQLPSGAHYEVSTGPSESELSPAGSVTSPNMDIDITPGQHLFWRVRTVLPDTSFISGLFRFVTYQPFALPFKEDFENYPSYTYFTEQADSWIRAATINSISTDGRIDPTRRFEGKQSLKLMNASDIRLPMTHLFQSVLYVSMELMIEDGCIATVKLNDINGANLDLYFKSNGRCDIVFNNKVQAETPFKNGEWFSLQVNLYSKGKEIWVTIGSSNFPFDWTFTGDLVHINEMELLSAPGTIWPTDGNPTFRVDEIQIKASGSVGTDVIPLNPEIKIYPNPARGAIFVEIPPNIPKAEIQLIDLSGKYLSSSLTQAGQGKWRMDRGNIPPGIYLIRVAYADKVHVAKICLIK